MSGSVGTQAVPSMTDPLTNTYLTGAAKNIREDLADLIYSIDPWECPMVGAIGSKEAEAVSTEWLVQELATADDNAQKEGFRFAPQTAKPADRMRNTCQIMVRSVTVSRTLGVTNTVGGDEFDRQSLLKGREVKRDLEYAITRGHVRVSTEPRYMSGAQTWINHGSMGAGAGVMPIGDGSNAPVAGTPRSMTLDLINDGFEQAWNSGGRPNLALMGSKLKRAFSALSQGGTGSPIVAQNIVQATEPGPVTIVGATDVYLSDFGRLNLAPDLFMPTTLVLGIDTMYFELAPLPQSDMVAEEYAKTGDARDGAVVFEGTLRALAPKAHFMVGDLTP